MDIDRARQLNRIASSIFGVLLLIAFAGLAHLVYDFSAGGIAYLFGNAAVILVVCALLSLALSRTRYRPYRAASALGLALAIFLFTNRDPLSDALDGRAAEPLLRSSQNLADYQRHARENPSNRMLVLTAKFMELSQEQTTRVNEIVAAIEPADVGDVSQIDRMDQRQLNALAEGLGRALQRAQDAPGKIGLVDADIRKRLVGDAAFASADLGRDMIRGFEQGLVQARPLQRASIEAEARLYAVLQDLAVFLSSQSGRYVVQPDGLRFADPAAVDRHGQLVEQFTAAANGATQAQAAIEAFEQARARTSVRQPSFRLGQ